MGISVKVDMPGVGKKLDAICKNKQVGQRAADAGMKVMNERYVPRYDGFLRSSAVATPFHVKWRTPYAHKQWTGNGISRRTTPGTRSHWEEPRQVKESIAQAVTDQLKRM